MSTNTSEAYLDIVTGVERAWPPAYDACIMRECPNCGADILEMCTNPIHNRYRKTPCVARITQGTG